MNQERVYSLVSRTMKEVSCGWRTHLADTFGSMLLPWCRAIFGPPVLWESALTAVASYTPRIRGPMAAAS